MSFWLESINKNLKKRNVKNKALGFKDYFFSRDYVKKRRDRLVSKLNAKADRLQFELENEGSWDRQDQLSKKRKEIKRKAGKMKNHTITYNDDVMLFRRLGNLKETLSNRRKKVEGRKYRESKVKDLEYAINYLVQKSILSKKPEISKKQLESLRPWTSYFAEENYDDRFVLLVLGSLLNYDVNWNKRDGNDSMDFPTFPSNGHAILGKMYTFYSILEEIAFEFEKTEQGKSLIISDEVLFDLGGLEYEEAKTKSFKEVFLMFKNVEDLSKEARVGSETVPGSGKWKQKFSFVDKDGGQISEKDKRLIATQLAESCESSEDLCLKGYSKAKEYLESGDIYIYTITKKGKRKDGTRFTFEVPEVVIHIKMDTDGREFVNPSEIHGNAPNQGIYPEFLPIARKWIEESEFENKDEFEVKFADAEMFAQIEDKLNKIEALIKNDVEVTQGGKDDLTPQELKSLYQIYRSVTSFEIGAFGNTVNDKVRKLKGKRFRILTIENYKSTLIRDTDFINNDYQNMFGCKSKQIISSYSGGDSSKHCSFDTGEKIDLTDRLIEHNFVAILGDTNTHLLNKLKTVKEITGELIRFDIDFDPEVIRRLTYIHGIFLTDEDKEKIISGKIDKFPMPNDPRLKRIFY